MTRPYPAARPFGVLGRLAAVVRGLAALTALTAMLAGVPAALLVIEPPLPDPRLPRWDEIVTVLSRPDDGTLFLLTLTAIAWLSWAAFALCALLEAVAIIRRLPARQLPLLRWPQAAAAGLIAAIVVMLMPVSRATAAFPHADIVATALHEPTRPATPAGPAQAPRPRAPTMPVKTIVVHDGDTLWGLAETHLGDGRHYQQIADLNYGRLQPDGDTLTDSHWLTPGWRLLIPVTDIRPTAGDYVVQPGDTLYGIAATHLGDGERYPEIADLNRGRPQPDGGTLTDPDLVRPGWILRLPDAPAPDGGHGPTTRENGTAAAPKDTPPTAPSEPAQPTTPQSAAPQPTIPQSATPQSTAPQTAIPRAGSLTSAPAAAPSSPPAAPMAPTPTPTTTSAPSTISGNSTSRPTSQPSPPTTTTRPESPRPVTTDDEGIHLPGSYIPWTLASAISASVALLWLQRRRRWKPGSLDHIDDLTHVPDPVETIRRRAAAHPDLPHPFDLAERANTVPTQAQPPPGGLALTGPGAEAAARAALVTALAAGTPTDPDNRSEVVIDGATLSYLIGVDAAAHVGWPRLHIADDIDHALALIEAQLLHRARILDENTVPDLDTLRVEVPDEEPLPTILLIAPAPPADVSKRARTAIALGTDVGITAVFLGDTDHTPNVLVDPDGHTHVTDTTDVPGIPDRLAVLDTATAIDILDTLHEAQTGTRPHPTTTDAALPPGATVDRTADRKPAGDAAAGPSLLVDEDRGPAPASADGQAKAQLCVLGTPHVANIAADGRALRARAAELAVYLACHPDGADIRTIGGHLEPDQRLRQADAHVHTSVSNLRHVLGRAAGFRKLGYVIKTNGRYRLDPTTVDVDLWQLRRLIAHARAADPADRIDLVRQACDLYTAPLADGLDDEWIEPHREAARRDAVDAHRLLADLLTDHAPQEAASVLDRATALDPYNEELYRRAMRLRHGFGDHAGVRLLYRSLKNALTELDAEPEAETLQLIETLRLSM